MEQNDTNISAVSSENKKPGIAGIVAGWGVFSLTWFFVGKIFYMFPLAFLRGDLITFLLDSPFSRGDLIRHSGWALDQPTIGKFLFLFSNFSLAALLVSLGLRLLCRRETRAQRVVFAVALALISFWVLSILSWPFWMLVKFTLFGITPLRLVGIVFMVFCGLTWIAWCIVASMERISRRTLFCVFTLALLGPLVVLARYFSSIFYLISN